MHSLFSNEKFYDQPFTILVFLACFVMMYLVMSSVWRRFWILSVISGVLFGAALVLLSEANWKAENGCMPVYDTVHIAGLLIVLLLAVACAVRYVFRVKAGKTGAESIREAFNTLPDAICFFNPAGTIKLCNGSMYKIFYELAQKDLQSYEELKCAMGDRDEIRIADHTWQYKEVRMRDGVIQSVFMDVSDQIRLKEELSVETEKLKDIYNDLKEFSENVLERTRWQEILDGKMRLHNALGAGLTAMRRLLKGKNEVRVNDLSLIKHAVDVLCGAAETGPFDADINDLKNDAAALGVEFKMTGDLPEDPEYGAFFVAVVREVLSNGVRHSDTDRIDVRMFEDDEHYFLETDVEGNMPEENITPKGGLRNIMEKAARYGGEVTLDTAENMAVRLKLPKKKDHQEKELGL